MSSDEITEYRFYPTVRQGYRPESTFSLESSSDVDSSTLGVTLTVRGRGGGQFETADASVNLDIYGPGDVIGIDRRQVVRTEPAADADAFPASQFPAIEFDRADFPWLFSPKRADEKGRNQPWLCLVTVERDRCSLSVDGNEPLPRLDVSRSELPDPDESWAWAHAQIVGDPEAIDERTEFTTESDITVSRLVSPRNLQSNTAYVACVVPTFAAGAKAGLGEEVPRHDSSEVAWGPDDDDPIRLPVYFHWEFTTGVRGDFVSLAKELDAEDLGPEVGFRTVDVSDPGPETLMLSGDRTTGTVGLGGALTSADVDPDVDPYDDAMIPDPADPNERTLPGDVLAALLDSLGESGDTGLIDETASGDLPVVGPPMYGQWHAGRSDVSETPHGNWFRTLNTDPRHRLAAGAGAEVVREHQESLMAAAWDQFGELREANEQTRSAQIACSALTPLHDRLEDLDFHRLLSFAAPVLDVVASDAFEGVTLGEHVARSSLPRASLSPSLGRIARPGGPLDRRIGAKVDPGTIVEEVVSDDRGLTGPDAFDDYGRTVETELDEIANSPFEGNGEDTTVPDFEEWRTQSPATVPEWRLTDDGEQMTLEEAIDYYVDNPDTSPEKRRIAEAVGSLLDAEKAILFTQRAVTETKRAYTKSSDGTAVSKHALEAFVDQLDEIGQTITAVTQRMAKVVRGPSTDAFADELTEDVLETELSKVQMRYDAASSAVMTAVEEGQTDDSDGKLIEAQLTATSQHLGRLAASVGSLADYVVGGDLAEQVGSSKAERTIGDGTTDNEAISQPTDSLDETPLDPEQVTQSLIEALEPERELRGLVESRLGIKNLDERPGADTFDELRASPQFFEPMSRYLSDLDSSWLLPGVGRVPKNSVGALVTNQPFVEAFMAGLNHEMARELHWRGFPTDRKGSYFQHFWNSPDPSADVLPIHTWNGHDLGENQLPTRPPDRVVLLVRGELLRRYPNTTLYAAKAVGDENGNVEDRVPALPKTHVGPETEGGLLKRPLFSGSIDPDVAFFGFDLGVQEAVYDPYHEDGTLEPNDRTDEGWFFILEEAPGEPRFGLDDDPDATYGEPPETWDDLVWEHVLQDPDGDAYVSVSEQPTRGLAGRASRVEKGDGSIPQDDTTTWGYNSAHMAHITLQQPGRVAIHADDLLPESERRA